MSFLAQEEARDLPIPLVAHLPPMAATSVMACASRVEDGYAFLPTFLWDWLREKNI
jgi:hypothetical protein